MNLILVLTLLTFLSAYINRVISWVLKLLPQGQDSHLQTLNESIVELRKDLAAISMADEFAKHARIQRKINKLAEERKKLAKHQFFHQKKAQFVIGITLSFLTRATLFILVCLNRSEIVAIMPPEWTWPLSSFLNFFNDVPGAITVPCWTIISTSVFRTISQNF